MKPSVLETMYTVHDLNFVNICVSKMIKRKKY